MEKKYIFERTKEGKIKDRGGIECQVFIQTTT